MTHLSRRRFVLLSALSAAASAFWSACARFQPGAALTPDERRIVDALADQVIPPDDPVAASAPSGRADLNRRVGAAAAVAKERPVFTPGGKDAGVGEFIDRQLRGPYRRYLPTYRTGLAKIDETSRRMMGAPFADLPFARQTALLEALEGRRLPGTSDAGPDSLPRGIWKPGEAAEFFRLVVDHCLQGFYGSPRHGGNRDAVSWKMLRLDQPQVLGRVVAKS